MSGFHMSSLYYGQHASKPGNKLMFSPEFELLRLMVGLVHFVPDAEIRMSAPAGSNLSVSMSEEADIDIRDLRQLLVSSIHKRLPDVSQWIRIVEVCGSLEHCGGGIYRSRCWTNEQRWFATSLPSHDRSLVGLRVRI